MANSKKSSSRRQRRIARRKNEILEAAAKIFAQKGYAHTTTKEIAEAADIAEGTLYNYFPSKRELLQEIALEAQAPMENAILDSTEFKNRDAIVSLFERALNISNDRLPFTRTLLNEAWVGSGKVRTQIAARVTQIHQQLAERITECIEAGFFRPINPQIGARLAMGMFAALVLPAIQGHEPFPSPEQRHQLAEEIVDFLLYGIAAQ